METFSERFSYAIKLRGLRQVQISEATGLSEGKISSYVSGKYKPNGKTLTVLARALSVNPEWLAGTSDEMEPPKVSPILSSDAAELVSKYNRLDPLDKGKTTGYVDSLLEADKYRIREKGQAG